MKAVVFYPISGKMKHWSEADKITQDEIEFYKPVFHADGPDCDAGSIYNLLNLEGNPLSTPENQAYIRKHNIGHTSFSSGDLIYYYEEDKLLVAGGNLQFKELPKDLRNTHMEAIRMVKDPIETNCDESRSIAKHFDGLDETETTEPFEMVIDCDCTREPVSIGTNLKSAYNYLKDWFTRKHPCVYCNSEVTIQSVNSKVLAKQYKVKYAKSE